MTAPASIDVQRQSWNEWNTEFREPDKINWRSKRQAGVILEWLKDIGRRDLNILEVGCASGWFSEALADYGRVTATDLADEPIARAKKRAPHINFIAGDFAAVGFNPHSFDVVVHLEVLAHVADQPAFMAKIAGLLKPGGHMMLATQNPFTLARMSSTTPVQPGRLRIWVNARELKALVRPHFEVVELRPIIVDGDRGILRVVNAPKVAKVMNAVIGPAQWELWRERLWGHTLMLDAIAH